MSAMTAAQSTPTMAGPGRRRVLAVDGGGSAIRVGLGAGEAPVDVDPVLRGGDAIEGVAAAVADGWRRLGSPSVDRAVLGLTTAPADPIDADRLARLVAGVTGAAEVWVADDAVTTHAGALSMGWGVSVSAGTGVACLSMPAAGEPRIVAGYGFLLGDEGGAYWIGREGLRQVLRGRDGRGAPSGLAAAAARRFGELDDVHVRLHDDSSAVNAIAQFAQDVLEAAGAGLAAATAIVDEAARELQLLATAAAAHAGASPEAPALLALGGRLLEQGTALRTRLEARIALDDAPLVPRSACAPPLDGAHLLGLENDPGRYASLVHVWRAEAEPTA
jgi:N-acetylglucosamine kinase-like BadF-type ATPase